MTQPDDAMMQDMASDTIWNVADLCVQPNVTPTPIYKASCQDKPNLSATTGSTLRFLKALATSVLKISGSVIC